MIVGAEGFSAEDHGQESRRTRRADSQRIATPLPSRRDRSPLAVADYELRLRFINGLALGFVVLVGWLVIGFVGGVGLVRRF